MTNGKQEMRDEILKLQILIDRLEDRTAGLLAEVSRLLEMLIPAIDK